MVLIDFSSASFYATTDEEEKEEVAQRFQQANNGVQMHSLMEGNKFETMPVSTSSDAVLRGADNLPADEACALIYCALQEIFPEVDLLFAINSLGGNYDFFIKSRGDDFFWEELTVDDPMAGPLKMTIRAALRNLLAMRESCTEAQRTAEVQAAVGAVYRLKPFKFKC